MLFLDKKGQNYWVFLMKYDSCAVMGLFLLCYECSLLIKVCEIWIFKGTAKVRLLGTAKFT